MFRLFTLFADLITWRILKLDSASSPAQALHFFIEDTTKIFVLLLFMIYLISFLRAGIKIEKIRDFLSGKKRIGGYLLASLFGAITPFCSCSGIPLFLGFTAAGIPLGITMAFLITSPMINEVAVVLLGSILGLRFTVLYIITGIAAGIIGGAFIDLIHAEKYLTPLGSRALDADNAGSGQVKISLSAKDRHNFAVSELKAILKRVWIWVIIGVGLGALLHGFVPDEFIADALGDGQWWSVPAAVILGIPLYANASGVIPVVESLINKGLPVGTAMAFMMSVVAASFPEFVLLKQVMKIKLLLIFFLMLVLFFTAAGWIFNLVF